MTDKTFRDFFYDAADGLRLHARLYGKADPDLLPVVCLPGLTRNARDFHRLALFLSTDAPTPRYVIAFDYRGRGESAYDPNWQNYTVGTELADLLHGLATLGIARAHFIGTSRGGLIMQVLAAIRPDLIASAVLNDIGPVIEREGLDQIRGYLANPTRILSVSEAIDSQKAVHGKAFSALTDDDWAAMADAIYRVDNGVPVPDFDPQLIKTLTTADPHQPLPELWTQFEALAPKPVLVIRGANSLLLSEATLQKMAQYGATVETTTVAGQGHAPLLESGDLPHRISALLNKSDPA